MKQLWVARIIGWFTDWQTTGTLENVWPKNGRAALRDLDRYLRAIWLECCGHCPLDLQ